MRKSEIKRVIYSHILLFILFICYYFLNTNFGFKIVCPFHEITGYLCPGCGITRCLFSMIKGDFVQAFYYNQLVFIFLPFFIIFYLYSLYIRIFDKKKKLQLPDYVYVFLLIITILFGIIRNII